MPVSRVRHGQTTNASKLSKARALWAASHLTGLDHFGGPRKKSCQAKYFQADVTGGLTVPNLNAHNPGTSKL